jgi:hypothetical protein
MMRSGLWFLWYGVTPGEIWRTSSRDINYMPSILLLFRIFHFLMFCKVMCNSFWQPLYFICLQHFSDYTSQLWHKENLVIVFVCFMLLLQTMTIIFHHTVNRCCLYWK